MPHALLRFWGGVNTTETPALNENSGVSASNLVRYFYDPNLFGVPLLGKLGGWTRFFSSMMAAIVRALWAWEDLDENAWLAVGTQVITGQSDSQVAVITGGALTNITPTQASSAIPVTSGLAVATIGSASIVINDNVTPGITNANSVYIPTQMSVGGVLLFGLYPCDPDGYSGANSYTVEAVNELGALVPAISTAPPTLPTFSTTADSNVVTVQLAGITTNSQYAVGDTWQVLLETSVGGLTLYGNYIIQSIIDENTLTFLAAAPATSTASAQLNGNTAVFIYNGLGSGPASAKPIGATDWTMDNFGQDLVFCPTSPISGDLDVPYQPIFLWTPDGGQATATVIPQAPPVNDGIFVAMPQRQIVAWGSTATGIQDPLLINWCDVNNPKQWIALVTNQAGSNRIPKGSRIVGCLQGPQQAIVWTDIDCWSMQYIGTPDIYSFNEIGTGCGLIARKAACSLNGIFYWMGPQQFYSLGGSGVAPLLCPIWDVVFQNLDTTPAALSKIRAAVNSRFGEVEWFYPSANGGGEIDSYVKYNAYMNVWDYGSLGRSAWIDQSVLGPPIGADPASLYLYQHETSNDADGVAMQPYFQSGYFALQEGDLKTFVDLVWPDMRWGTWEQLNAPGQYAIFPGGQAANLPGGQGITMPGGGGSGGTVELTFFCADYPGDTPTVYGPYSVTQATQFFNTRLRARLVSIRIGSTDLGSFWRIGAIRYRYAPDGRF
jgi:hypothetical protein